MKKTKFIPAALAVTAALFVAGCDDNGTGSTGGMTDRLLDDMYGPYYTLIANASPEDGGRVTPQAQLGVTEGSYVLVTASPASKYRFDKWEVNVGKAEFRNPNNNSDSVKMFSDAVVTAKFIRQNMLHVAASPSGAGSVSGGGQYDNGTRANISATAYSGYEFNGWTGSSYINSPSSANTSVTVNYDSVTVTANFVPIYTLTVRGNDDNGGTVSPTSTSGLRAGRTVNITATPNEIDNYVFVNWSLYSSSSNSVINNPNNRNTTVTVNENTTVIANFRAPYWLETSTRDLKTGNTPPNGSVTVTKTLQQNTLAGGTDYNISADIVDNNYIFVNWTRSDTTAKITDSTSRYTTVKLTDDATVTANFKSPYSLTLSQRFFNTTNSFSFGTVQQTYVSHDAEGTVLTISAEVNSSYIGSYDFIHWAVSSVSGNSQVTFADSTSSTTTVKIHGNATVTAYFRAPYQLSTYARLNNTTSTTYSGSVNYQRISNNIEGTVYEISAVLVDTQYRFVRWETTNVSAVIDDIYDPNTTVKLKDGSATVYAYFAAPYTLSLSRTPTTQVNNPNTGYFEYVVSLNSEFVSNTANGTVWKISTSASDSTYRFVNWTTNNSSNTTFYYQSDSVATVRLTGAATVTANFAAGYIPTFYRRYWNGSNYVEATSTTVDKTFVSNTAANGTVWDITTNLFSPDTAYRFLDWSATAKATSTSTAVSASTYATITTPLTNLTTRLTLTGNASIYAYFVPVYTLSYTDNVSGLTDSVIKRGNYVGSVVNISKPTKAGYTFTGWTISSNLTINPDSTQVTFSTASPATVTANFTVEHTLNSVKYTDTRDGKEYTTVKIGSQTWMAENLNYSLNTNAEEGGLGIGKCYGSDTNNCATYGRLYTWAEAMGIDASFNSTSWNGSDVKHQGACPVGWHVPSDAEWTTLTNAVGGSSYAGTKLKTSTYWTTYSGVPAGTNEFDFSALPGGSGYSDGSFFNAGDFGFWWSSTEGAA